VFERRVRVGKAVADGMFCRAGVTFYVEVDHSQNMTRAQLRDKWARYGKFSGLILVICHSKGRLRSLLRDARETRIRAVFTTFRMLAWRRNRRVWIDRDLKRSELPSR
jgi:hypothetical protein